MVPQGDSHLCDTETSDTDAAGKEDVMINVRMIEESTCLTDRPSYSRGFKDSGFLISELKYRNRNDE